MKSTVLIVVVAISIAQLACAIQQEKLFGSSSEDPYKLVKEAYFTWDKQDVGTPELLSQVTPAPAAGVSILAGWPDRDSDEPTAREVYEREGVPVAWKAGPDAVKALRLDGGKGKLAIIKPGNCKDAGSGIVNCAGRYYGNYAESSADVDLSSGEGKGTIPWPSEKAPETSQYVVRICNSNFQCFAQHSPVFTIKLHPGRLAKKDEWAKDSCAMCQKILTTIQNGVGDEGSLEVHELCKAEKDKAKQQHCKLLGKELVKAFGDALDAVDSRRKAVALDELDDIVVTQAKSTHRRLYESAGSAVLRHTVSFAATPFSFGQKAVEEARMGLFHELVNDYKWPGDSFFKEGLVPSNIGDKCVKKPDSYFRNPFAAVEFKDDFHCPTYKKWPVGCICKLYMKMLTGMVASDLSVKIDDAAVECSALANEQNGSKDDNTCCCLAPQGPHVPRYIVNPALNAESGSDASGAASSGAASGAPSSSGADDDDSDDTPASAGPNTGSTPSPPAQVSAGPAGNSHPAQTPASANQSEASSDDDV